MHKFTVMVTLVFEKNSIFSPKIEIITWGTFTAVLNFRKVFATVFNFRQYEMTI
jgi:hypothetical protein